MQPIVPEPSGVSPAPPAAGPDSAAGWSAEPTTTRPAPQVSVIIPTYQGQDFVLRTLESVFAQSFADYEIIVINDGSSDDTAARLRPLAEAGRIRYIEQAANTGQATACNRGLARARGEFVAFLDHDDLWPADKLAWQVEFLRANPDVGLVGGLVELMDERERPKEVRYVFEPGPLDLEFLFHGSPFESSGQWLARTKTVRQVGGFDPRFWGTDDYDFLLRAARATRIVGVHRLALCYRQHPSNMSKNLLGMLVNSEAVVRSNLAHLPAERRPAAARAAYRFLYPYLGRPLLGAAWRDLKSGRVARGGKTLWALGKTFLWPALRDHRTFFRILALGIRRRLPLRRPSRTVDGNPATPPIPCGADASARPFQLTHPSTVFPRCSSSPRPAVNGETPPANL